jgi:hypothetical protein
MRAPPTLQEFLSGEPLRYPGYDGKQTEATYRTGDGIYIERRGVDLGKANVVEDRAAARFYANATRAKQ